MHCGLLYAVYSPRTVRSHYDTLKRRFSSPTPPLYEFFTNLTLPLMKPSNNSRLLSTRLLEGFCIGISSGHPTIFTPYAESPAGLVHFISAFRTPETSLSEKLET